MAMDGPHDLGGRPGFGRVPVDAARPFSAGWQPLAQALASVTAGIAGVNGDALRHVMEKLPAADYHRLGYSGRWLEVAERCALLGGLVADGEVVDRARRRAAGQPPLTSADYPEPAEPSPPAGRRGPAHAKREPPPDAVPAFAVGAAVKVRDLRPAGHTRLPAYLRGRRGEIALLNGFWVYPDRHADSGDEAPTWVYAVRFRADDLWPGAGDHEVCADLFEPYLEAAHD